MENFYLPIIGEYHLPKGTQVVPNIFSIHMNEKYFDNPEEFRPERFIDEDGKAVRPEYLIPFSIGKRACPGEIFARNELLIVTAYLFKRFTFAAADGFPLTAKAKDIALGCIPEAYQITAERRD